MAAAIPLVIWVTLIRNIDADAVSCVESLRHSSVYQNVQADGIGH